MIIKRETIDLVKTSIAYTPDHYAENVARYIINAYNNNIQIRVMVCHLHHVFGIKKWICRDLIKEVVKG